MPRPPPYNYGALSKPSQSQPVPQQYTYSPTHSTAESDLSSFDDYASEREDPSVALTMDALSDDESDAGSYSNPFENDKGKFTLFCGPSSHCFVPLFGITQCLCPLFRVSVFVALVHTVFVAEDMQGLANGFAVIGAMIGATAVFGLLGLISLIVYFAAPDATSCSPLSLSLLTFSVLSLATLTFTIARCKFKASDKPLFVLAPLMLLSVCAVLATAVMHWEDCTTRAGAGVGIAAACLAVPVCLWVCVLRGTRNDRYAGEGDY